MISIHVNRTQDLVDLPKNRKALLCRWVYRLNQTTDSPSPKYKARIVAKGFRQEYGVDFDEVFSPVIKMTTLRFLLRVVAAKNLQLDQLDIKTAFLHGDLDKEIYMEQPQGFASLGQEHLFCRLRKSLYGLKQAPRQWYRKFDEFLQSIGFLRSDKDHSLYRMTHRMGVPSSSSFMCVITLNVICEIRTHNFILNNLEL